MLLDSDRGERRRQFKEERPHLVGVRGAFAAYQLELRRNGYSPLATRPGTKKPIGEGWSRRCQTPLTDAEIDEIIRHNPAAGIGVACGYNNLVVIDVDTERPEIVGALKLVLPEALVIKCGRRGYSIFLRSNRPIQSRRFRGTDGETLVEILAVGCQTVLPPTIHPDTGLPYRWLTEATPLNTRIEDLPLYTYYIPEKF